MVGDEVSGDVGIGSGFETWDLYCDVQGAAGGVHIGKVDIVVVHSDCDFYLVSEGERFPVV